MRRQNFHEDEDLYIRFTWRRETDETTRILEKAEQVPGNLLLASLLSLLSHVSNVSQHRFHLFDGVFCSEA